MNQPRRPPTRFHLLTELKQRRTAGKTLRDAYAELVQQHARGSSYARHVLRQWDNIEPARGEVLHRPTEQPKEQPK